MRRRVAPTIAATMALAAFAIAVAAGILVQNPPDVVLLRALLALCVCYGAGNAAGVIAQRIVDGEIEAHRDRNPVADTSALDDMYGLGKSDSGAPVEAVDDEEVLMTV